MENKIYSMKASYKLTEYPYSFLSYLAIVSTKSSGKAKTLLEDYLKRKQHSTFDCMLENIDLKDTGCKSDKEWIMIPGKYSWDIYYMRKRH